MPVASLALIRATHVPSRLVIAVVVKAELFGHLEDSRALRRGLGLEAPASDFVRDAVARRRQEAVLLPLRALACLPRRSADVAELRAANARHVVAASFELDVAPAPRAALPALLLRELEDRLRVGVLRARDAGRVRGCAGGARRGGARWTHEPRRRVRLCAEEARARGVRAIHPAHGAQLRRLRFEALQEVGRDEGADFCEWDFLLAATRREQGLVRHRGLEEVCNATRVVRMAAWCAQASTSNATSTGSAFDARGAFKQAQLPVILQVDGIPSRFVVNGIVDVDIDGSAYTSANSTWRVFGIRWAQHLSDGRPCSGRLSSAKYAPQRGTNRRLCARSSW